MAIVVFTTKYLAPTDTLGARIAVNGPRGRVIYDYDYSRNADQLHASCVHSYIACDDDLLEKRLIIEDIHPTKVGYTYYFRYNR